MSVVLCLCLLVVVLWGGKNDTPEGVAGMPAGSADNQEKPVARGDTAKPPVKDQGSDSVTAVNPEKDRTPDRPKPDPELVAKPPDRPNPTILSDKTWIWSGSRDNYARYSDLAFEVGMGNNPGGFGCADVGLEIERVRFLGVSLTVPMTFAPPLDENSFAGFFVDYHTANGYTKRVALSIGMHSERRSTKTPVWGKFSRPNQFVNLGRPKEYDLDFQKWAPEGWDGKIWFVVSLQNTGRNTKLQGRIVLRPSQLR
jgi:hypothetical protein